MHLVMIGGSDAGISAALRARELDPGRRGQRGRCGRLPELLDLRHPLLRLRRGAPLAQPGPPHHRRPGSHRDARCGWTPPPGASTCPAASSWSPPPAATRNCSAYDKLIIGTGAVPVRPPIGGLAGPGALGPDDGVHLLHSMGDTFAVMRTLEQAAPASAVIVGAGYIGLEMADALTVRGLRSPRWNSCPRCCPPSTPTSARWSTPSWPPTASRC